MCQTVQGARRRALSGCERGQICWPSAHGTARSLPAGRSPGHRSFLGVARIARSPDLDRSKSGLRCFWFAPLGANLVVAKAGFEPRDLQGMNLASCLTAPLRNRRWCARAASCQGDLAGSGASISPRRRRRPRLGRRGAAGGERGGDGCRGSAARRRACERPGRALGAWPASRSSTRLGGSDRGCGSQTSLRHRKVAHLYS